MFIVTNKDGDIPILGSKMMSLLGFNKECTIEKDVYLHGTDIAVPYDEPVKSKSNLARIFENGVSNSSGGADNNEAKEEQWLDLGEDSRQNNPKRWQIILKEQLVIGYLTMKKNELVKILAENSDVLHLSLGKGTPANVETMFTELFDNVKPVKAAQSHYSTPKIRFMECILSRVMYF